jgi:hypothetical protein
MCAGQVYTPAQHRGYGYASALVANLGQVPSDEASEFFSVSSDLAGPVTDRVWFQDRLRSRNERDAHLAPAVAPKN